MKSEELQKKNLDYCLMIILNEINRVCANNNIKYFLVGGSLLGAIRHNNIIPWDDDMDIGLLRSDYDKFVKICDKELNGEFYITTADNEKNYGQPYCKVRLKNTIFEESLHPKKNDIRKGIFVDVFPVDSLPINKSQQITQKIAISIWKNALLLKCRYVFDNNQLPLRVRALSFLPSLLSKKNIIKRLNLEMTRYNSDKVDYYTINCETPYGREIFPVWCLSGEALPRVKFGNLYIPIPNHPELYLTKVYGDFMQLPPKQERVFRHASNSIDFGPYEFQDGE